MLETAREFDESVTHRSRRFSLATPNKPSYLQPTAATEHTGYATSHVDSPEPTVLHHTPTTDVSRVNTPAAVCATIALHEIPHDEASPPTSSPKQCNLSTANDTADPPYTHWTSAKFCGPFCQRPCKNHNVELLSSDDEESNGLEQMMTMAKRFGNLNFPPLNPLNQSRWTNSTARPANPAADPANTADRRTTGEATTNRIRPEAAVSVYVTVKTANAYDTPREMVTLEVEDIPVIVPGEGCVCITCYEIIPESQYESHRNRRICHSPARPPEAERDNLSCIATAQRIELSCNTCHRKFKSEHAKDSHEPCEAIRKDAPTKIDARRQPKLFTSTTPADTRRREAQISTNAAGRIVAYRAAIRKPDTRGTYNVNGKVMSMQDIKRRIQNLSSLLIK